MNEYQELIPEDNEYAGLLDEIDAAEKTGVRVSLKATQGRTPEQQVDINDLAQRAQLPTDVVARNTDQVRAQVEANEYDKLIDESPELAGWLSSPENAAIGRDDVSTLSRISKAMQANRPSVSADQAAGFGESLSRIPQTITKTLLTDPIIELTDDAARPRKSIGGVTDSGYTDPITGEFVDQGYPDSRRYFEAAPSFEKDLNTIARGINESLKVDAEASAAELPESIQQQRTTPGINAAKILDNLGQIPAYALALFAPGKLIEGGLKGVKALSQAERATIAGAATNSAVIGSQTYNDAYQSAYDNYISLGAHPEEAAYKAQYQAQKAARTMRAIAAVTGAFGEGAALTTATLKEIPKAAFKNSVTEVAEELNQSALTKAAGGEHLTQDEVIEIAALSAILGGGVGATMAGANVMLEKQRARGTAAVQSEQNIDEIATAAQQSKLLPRSPEKFKEAVREMGQKSGQEAVYIPVEALTEYYQSKGIDPGAEVAKLTGSAEAYQEAIETGSDIKIPIENFAADIAPLHYEGLKQHIRTDPESMTPTEAAEFEKNQEEIAAGFVDTEEQVDTSPQVYDAVLAELVDAGIETKAAEKQAKLYSSVFRSMGQRTGLDPVTLYNRYGLTVSRADMPTVERRKDSTERQNVQSLKDRVAEMRAKVTGGTASPAELDALIGELSDTAFQSRVTGLPGRLAYEETKGDPNPALPSKGEGVFHISGDEFQVLAGGKEISVDADSLKWVNDNMSPATGDQLLREIGQAIQKTFDPKNPTAGLAAAQKLLDGAILDIQKPDGEIIEIQGIRFTHGNPANTKNDADFSLKSEKKRREQEGLRAGRDQEPSNVRRSRGPEPDPEGLQAAQGPVRKLAQGDTTLNQAPADAGVSVSGQTETPAFQKWFGDSKVVDADGKPLVVYHQTSKENEKGILADGFNADSPRARQRDEQVPDGMFFKSDAADISVGAADKSQISQIPVYLSIQNPFVVDSRDEIDSAIDDDEYTVLASKVRKLDRKLADEFDEKWEWLGKQERRGLSDEERAPIDAEWDKFSDDWQARLDSEMPKAAAAARERLTTVLRERGHDGMIINNDVGSFNRKTKTYVAFDSKQIKSATQNKGSFDPNDANILNQPPPPLDGVNRGQIKFNDERTQFSILLFKNADLSTLLHESGHFYFEVLGDLVRRGEASAQIMEDYQSILKWLGSDGKITQNQHEQFARGFEAYLMEGKAPSLDLQGAFARFRSWLVQIYRTVKNLDVELSDEIRAVFDRLVATEDEITAAEQAQDYRVVFGDNPTLQKIAAEAREAAETKLANQAMKEISRQEKATWKENRKRVMGEVAAQVNNRPVYQVLAYLGKGTLPDGSPLPEGMEPAKLSKKALLTQYDKDWITRNLFKKRVYTTDGGVDPELLAPAYGFESGDAMVRAIAAAEPREALIARETDAEMKRQYGDMMTDGTMRQKAMEAVHNGKREELLLAELRAIRKKQREAAPLLRQAQADDRQARLEAESILPSQKEMRFIKASAEQMISGKKVMDINPNLYRVAEAKAGRIAFEAAAKGDYPKAYDAKLQQIRNHALYRAATKAKADSESVLRFLKRFQKKGLRSKLGKVDRLEQVDMLLGRYDLRKVSKKAIDAAKAKMQLLTQIQSGLLTAPKAFTASLAGNDKINYRDETIESLRGLRDVLTQIRTEAMNEFEVMVNNEKIVLNDAADQMADTVMSNGKPVIPTYGELSAEERMREFGKSLVNAWLRTPTLARLLDNDQRGAWTRFVIEPVRKAVTEKLEPMKDKAQKGLAKLYSDHYSVKEMVRNNERSVVPGINMSLSRWDLISLALNWGNADNRKAVLESTVGERQPFTEAGVMRAFQSLDKRDWDFVQAVWSYVDSYWPEIKESQRRRRGITPPKVEADPFTVMTKDGQTLAMPGGYYPLKYNPRLDAKSRQNEIDDAFEKMRVGTVSATQTKHGHTQERIGSGGQPVMLSMGVLHNHINNVIMDIALGDAVIYVDKVLARPQVRQALIDTDNLDALESFKLWLKDVATGELSPRSGGEQAARFIRLGFAKSKIGFNLVTTALQITGLPQTMVVTGKQNFAKGVKEYAKNPRAAIRQVMSQSKLMQSRYELGAYNKEVQGVQEALSRKGAPASNASSKFARAFIATFNAVQIPPWLVHFAFMGMKYSQLQVDTVAWLAGYEQAKGRDLPHDEAVKFADGVVENAQTSGMWNDRAPIERGTLSANTRQNEYVKLLTTLGSYMIAKGNIAVERYKATDFKNVGQALGFAGDILLLFTAEAILGAAIRGQWPDDDEDWWAWTAAKTAGSMISTIPFLREFPAAMEGFSTGGPLGSFMADIGKAANQTMQAEIDLAMIKSYSNVIGTMTGYPSSQINRFIDAYWRESEGQDVAPIEYAVGRRN